MRVTPVPRRSLVLVAAVVNDAHLQRHLEQIAPMNAGLTIQTTTNLDSLVIGPWSGLGVLALWSLGALVLGGLALRLRDA